jgi:DnaK suppressor protein
MDASSRQNLRLKMQSLISSLQKEVAQLEELTLPISPENSIGRITRMDAINNKGVTEASLRNRKKKLSKMKAALSKIDDPDFGVCRSCRQLIDPQRLILLPESDYCIKCAR